METPNPSQDVLFQLLVQQFRNETLQSVARCSLGIIDNASSIQIDTAVQHNAASINRLLIKLLALNLISNTQNSILSQLSSSSTSVSTSNSLANNVNNLNNANNTNNNVQCKDASPPLLESTNSANNIEYNALPALETIGDGDCSDSTPPLKVLCEQNLLQLSPILGFARKDYFLDYAVSPDVLCHILSFVKINECYKTVSLLSKYFNQTLYDTFEQSSHFLNDISFENFKFSDFNEFKNSYFEDGRKVDCCFIGGRWAGAILRNYDSLKRTCSVYCHGTTFNSRVCDLAPFGSMTARPCHWGKLAHVLKRGYCSQTCDVNVRRLAFDSDKLHSTIHLLFGLQALKCDVWVCGIIDFNASCDYARVARRDFYNGKLGNLKKEGLFQVAVILDISKYYMQHSREIQAELIQRFELFRTFERVCVRLWFQIDDKENIAPFGSKADDEETDAAKTLVAKQIFLQHKGINSVKKILDVIEHKAYAIVTPEGVFDGRADEKNFLRWEGICSNVRWEPYIVSVDSTQYGVTKDALEKVHFDEKDECLYVYFAPYLRLAFFDKNAPKPFASRHIVAQGGNVQGSSKVRKAKITDARLHEKINKWKQTFAAAKAADDNNNNNNKDDEEEPSEATEVLEAITPTTEAVKDKYFKLLSEWVGYIRVTYDVTKEFDHFQEYMMYKIGLADEDDFDKRKYFVNGVNGATDGTDDADDTVSSDGSDSREPEMPWLKWDQEQDKIWYDEYILLDSLVAKHDDPKRDMFEFLRLGARRRGPKKLFESLDEVDDMPPWRRIIKFCDPEDVKGVCKKFRSAVNAFGNSDVGTVATLPALDNDDD